MDPLQVRLRATIEPNQRRSATQRVLRRVVFGWLFMDMRRFRAFARLLWLYQRSGVQWLARHLRILHLLGLAEAELLLPRIDTRFLIPRDALHTDGSKDRAAFFAGCVMSTALADVDRATLRLLERAGYRVVSPKTQGCCGALHAHGGDLPRALELARRNIVAFEGADDAPIVVNSAGCGAMLKDYAHHLRDDPAWAARAAAFSRRIKDLSEVLVGRLEPKSQQTQRVVYQDACHLLHAQRISKQPRELLRSVPGLKLDHILSRDPQLVVTANPGCLLQLQAGLDERGCATRVKHLATVLDEAT
jgi:glycolate oxidase iron-sulfur subunit